MRIISVDCETQRFRPGCQAAELVCVSWHEQGKSSPGLVHVADAEPLLREWFQDPNVLLVGQHFPYDLAVFCAAFPHLQADIFRAVDEDRVTDTKLREILLDVAIGRYRFERKDDGTKVARGYDLASMARRYLGVSMDKTTWRTGYGELVHLPVEEWPEGARHYAKDDATITLRVFEAQERLRHPVVKEETLDLLDDEFRQLRKMFSAQLTSVWGLRTDGAAVEKFRLETEASKLVVEAELVREGLVRPDGSRDTKAAIRRMLAVCKAEGLEVPRTKGARGKMKDGAVMAHDEGVALDSDSCEETGDPLLALYATNTKLGVLLSKDVPLLASGATTPIHARFSLLETGRVSTSPNIQNPAKAGAVRSTFRPRTGHVFIQADYGGMELATLAQVCLDLFGESRLAEVINGGEDPHVAMAATLGGMGLDEAKRLRKAKDKRFDEYRALAKIANFGLPGGLGPATLVDFAAAAGVALTLAEAKDLKAQWLRTWPEMRQYFTHINGLMNNGVALLKQVRSNRYRGGARYCEAANSYFQGLGSDLAGRAWWYLSRACYIESDSPLFGSRIVNMVHDEFIGESLEDRAHECAVELETLMVKGAGEFLPDVTIAAPPLLMRWWSKDAQAVMVDGRLVPWFGNCSHPGCGKPLLVSSPRVAVCQGDGHVHEDVSMPWLNTGPCHLSIAC
jgi:DNA polymerase-1